MATGRPLARQILEFQIFHPDSMRAANQWDDTFRQAKMIATADGKGTTARQDHTNIKRVKGQISTGRQFFRQLAEGGGDAPEADIEVLIHKRDLRRAGLLEEGTSDPMIRVNDRLMRVLDHLGRPQIDLEGNPGLYVEEVDQLSMGGHWVKLKLTPRREGED